MRGMDRLVQLRRGGFRPDLVALYVPGQGGSRAYEGTLLAKAGEHPSTTDLRALKGLTVCVMGRPFGGFEEAEGWARAAVMAGAQTVGLAFPAQPGAGLDGPVWFHVNGETLA